MCRASVFPHSGAENAVSHQQKNLEITSVDSLGRGPDGGQDAGEMHKRGHGLAVVPGPGLQGRAPAALGKY